MRVTPKELAALLQPHSRRSGARRYRRARGAEEFSAASGQQGSIAFSRPFRPAVAERSTRMGLVDVVANVWTGRAGARPVGLVAVPQDAIRSASPVAAEPKELLWIQGAESLTGGVARNLGGDFRKIVLERGREGMSKMNPLRTEPTGKAGSASGARVSLNGLFGLES